MGAHYAAADIGSGAVARALAAGVNLALSPAKTAAFTITGSQDHLPLSITMGSKALQVHRKHKLI